MSTEELQRLSPDSPDSCPGDVLEEGRTAFIRFGQIISDQGDEASPPTFLRTAELCGHRFWLWEVRAGESQYYLDIHLFPDGCLTTGGAPNRDGISPEEFIRKQYAIYRDA